MDYLLHLGYVLYLISYSVRDILWLRAITVVASVAFIVYSYLPEKPAYIPIVWLSIFAILNIFYCIQLLLERRPVQMSDEEAELYELVFKSIKGRDFLKLLKVATWKDAESGDAIITEGTDVAGVILITSGHARIDVKGRHVAESTQGQFVGEMSYLTNSVASADVVATKPTRYLFWPARRLNDFFSTSIDLEAAFVAILGVDLVSKVKERHTKITPDGAVSGVAT